MKTETIMKIQSKLGLVVDGIWGPKTAKALIQFQSQYGLIPNGVWTKETEGAFNRFTKTVELILQKCDELGVTKPEQKQYIIATALHETGGTLKPVKEFGGKKYLSSLYDPVLAKSQKLRDRAIRMGNTEQGDGVKYCGRGLVQLTWKSNYIKYSGIIGVDLVNNPDLVMDIEVAVYILVHGMKHGIFTGKKLDDYINSKGTDFINARRIINGSDKAIKIATLASISYKYL